MDVVTFYLVLNATNLYAKLIVCKGSYLASIFSSFSQPESDEEYTPALRSLAYFAQDMFIFLNLNQHSLKQYPASL